MFSIVQRTPSGFCFLSPSTVKMHQNRGIFPSLAIPAVRPPSRARSRFKRHAYTQYLNITAPEISISIAHRAEPLEGYTKPSGQRSNLKERNAPIFSASDTRTHNILILLHPRSQSRSRIERNPSRVTRSPRGSAHVANLKETLQYLTA